MMARCDTYVGDSTAASTLVGLLSDTVAPACCALAGFGWITSMHVADTDKYTVTSFWHDLDATVERGWAPARYLDAFDTSGMDRAKTTWYEIRSFARCRPTVAGNVVVVRPFTCSVGDVEETLSFAQRLSETAQSHDSLMFTVVELTDGPTINCVATWTDRDAADTWMSGPEKLRPADRRGGSGSVNAQEQIVGTVIYSRAGDDTR